MKIYRYYYMKKQIKMAPFNCTKGENGDIIITEGEREYGKRIKPENLDKMIDEANYVMWSLNENNLEFFRKLILKRKQKMLENKKKEYNELSNEISYLKKEVVVCKKIILEDTSF